MKKNTVLNLLAAAALVAADQFSKAYIAGSYALGESRVVLEGLLNFTYIHNYGAAWGILQNKRWFFLLVTLAVVVLGAVYIFRTSPQSRLLLFSFTLIGAGATGNAIDRVFFGYVRDFLEATFISFPVFNIADCSVVIGAGLLMLYLLLDGREKENDKNNPDGEGAA